MKSVHIGVDVSKEKLDVYVPAAKEGARPTTMEVDNNAKESEGPYWWGESGGVKSF